MDMSSYFGKMMKKSKAELALLQVEKLLGELNGYSKTGDIAEAIEYFEEFKAQLCEELYEEYIQQKNDDWESYGERIREQ